MTDKGDLCMRSIEFPKMFNSNSTNVTRAKDYHQATVQNTLLVLQTERNELLGDPYFGLMVKHYMFDQNNYILKDALIDMIYTQLAIFIPQVRVQRKDIDIVQDKERGVLYCNFKGTNQIDYQLDTYSLVLFNDSEATM